MDLSAFAEEVGADGPVTIAGAGSRGGPVRDVRTVQAPAGIAEVNPAEMTIRCGAGTPVSELGEALGQHGQRLAVPSGGTIGGALAVGRSGIRRLGYGPVRDTVLQCRFVSAGGEVVKAGGPTVKNVTGFDLCRLMVGSLGTLGFIGEVILRTRPIPECEKWFVSDASPDTIRGQLYRPISVLWDGYRTWVLLEGHPNDVETQAAAAGLAAADGPPELPTGARWSVRPDRVTHLTGAGRFVAEVGVGVVHHHDPQPQRQPAPAVVALNRRLKARFDPTGRLNPGVDVLAGE